jgi:2OG-Fe(II) oxygenase superfamily
MKCCIFTVGSACALASGGNNQLLPKTLSCNVAFKAFCNGHLPLVCIENAISEEAIAGLLQDASCLQSAGFGAPSGVVSKTRDIRQGVHQIWLQSPGTQPLNALVGNLDSRKGLHALVESIRQELCTKGRQRDLAPEYSELSYLLYDKGSFYRRHVDTSVRLTSDGRDHERCVSWLLYLGDPTLHTLDQRPWDCQLDGGALRIYGSDDFSFNGGLEADTIDQVDDFLVDISPNPGTLVLFDSAMVPHEVMTTHRPRSAIVGWFGRRTGVSPRR